MPHHRDNERKDMNPTNQSGAVLLPCPFCGNGAELARSEGVTGRKWYVRCKTVRCYLFLHNKETTFERRVEAVNDWNTRADTALHSRLTSLEGALKKFLRYFESGNAVPVERATILADSEAVREARALSEAP